MAYLIVLLLDIRSAVSDPNLIKAKLCTSESELIEIFDDYDKQLLTMKVEPEVHRRFLKIRMYHINFTKDLLSPITRLYIDDCRPIVEEQKHNTYGMWSQPRMR